MTSEHLKCDCHVFKLLLNTRASKRLERRFSKSSAVQTCATLRLAAFVLLSLQRPIRLRDGLWRVLSKNKVDRRRFFGSEQNMAGDFTQDASLTRICQPTCHLQQTCQLTRMEFGIETDQFPNCQERRGSDSVTLFCQCREKKKGNTFCLGCIVNFSHFFFSYLPLFIRHPPLHP